MKGLTIHLHIAYPSCLKNLLKNVLKVWLLSTDLLPHMKENVNKKEWKNFVAA